MQNICVTNLLGFGMLLVLSNCSDAKVSKPIALQDRESGIVPAENATALVLAAVGRTGSTLISQVFASVPGVFLVVEPYKRYLSINRSDKPGKRPPGAMPTLASLLDCSFAQSHHILNSIRWPFLCMHSRMTNASIAATFRKRCESDDPFDQEFALMVRSYCLQSSIRIVKTIRFSHVTESTRNSLRNLEQSPGYTVRILHVIRHPFKILLSQYNLGWHEVVKFRTCEHWKPECNISAEPVTFTDDQLKKLSDHFVSLGELICSWVTNTTVAMRSIGLSRGSTAVLRYEDFAPPSTMGALGALHQFFGLKYIEGYKQTIESVINTRHAGFRITGQEHREVHTAAIKSYGVTRIKMAESPCCQSLYKNFRYLA